MKETKRMRIRKKRDEANRMKNDESVKHGWREGSKD
jgi:hypothetical protein